MTSSSSSDTPDNCPSGGSASQSPESIISLHNNNNNNSYYQENNVEIKSPSWSIDSGVSPFDFDDHGLHKVRRKERQKTRRQVVQQHYDAFVQLVPVLRSRKSKSTLTKNAILKSTIHYINQLKEDSMTSCGRQLREQLRQEYERNTRLQKEFDLWRDKLHHLRVRKQKEGSVKKETT